MDIETMAKKLMQGEGGESLRKLAESDAGARLSAQFGGGAAEKAFRSGDEAQMRAILQGVLGTAEGRELAARVKEAMSGHGR